MNSVGADEWLLEGWFFDVYDCKLQQIACVNKMCFSFLGLLYFTITSMYQRIVSEVIR